VFILNTVYKAEVATGIQHSITVLLEQNSVTS